jgi:folylpolyglutamate synthase/dihydropteroate synthase
LLSWDLVCCDSAVVECISKQEIAREKAGIFKAGTPAFTIPQPVEAQAVLQVRCPCRRWRFADP